MKSLKLVIITFLGVLFCIKLNAQGVQTFQSIRLYHPTTQGQYISILPPNGITSYGLTLPAAQGAAGQVLTNNGSGVLSWATPSSSSDWAITGNSNITDGTHFLGTTNNVALNFRVNNDKAGRIGNNTDQNVVLGFQSGYSFSTGISNTIIGHQAGYYTSTGSYNTFIGSGAGQNNTTGEPNTFLGSLAGMQNTTGNYNHFIGNQAGRFTTTASYNFMEGVAAGYSNTTGGNNHYSGYRAGFTNITSNNNHCVGFEAGYNNTVANSHFVGYHAGRANTTGAENTFEGYQAGYSNTTGYANHYNGYQAGYTGATVNNNTAIGYKAMYTNAASNNVAVGAHTLEANTTGTQNTALGAWTLPANTTGNNNTALGNSSMQVNTTGYGNTAVGTATLIANIGGQDNTACGYYALRTNISGNFNAALGQHAGSLATGSNNTFLGGRSGYNTSTGGNNVTVGYEAGLTNTTGANNTLLGYQADVSSAALTKATAIGYNAKVAASNSLVLGGTGGDAVNVGIGTTTPSAKLHILGGSFLSAYSANPALPFSNSYNDFAAPIGTSETVGLRIINTSTLATGNTALLGFNSYNAGGATWGIGAYQNSTSIYDNDFFIGYSNGGVYYKRFYFKNDGSLGIGTVIPVNRLDVEGSAVIGASYSGTNTAPTNGLLVEGNVGVGATTPLAKIHQDNGNATANYHKFTAGTTTGITSTDGFDVGVDASGNAILNQNEALPLIMSANNSEVMRVTSAGNVLIGGNLTPAETTGVALVNQSANDLKDDFIVTTYNSTTTPAFVIFKARGTAAAPTALTNNENIGGFNSKGYNGTSFASLSAISTITAADFTTSFGADLAFMTGRTGTISERMRIMSTGNVGIGVTLPSHILQINGQGRATNSAWATTSDIRLKNIDGKLEYGLNEVMKINTYRFHYKKDNPLNLPTDNPFQGVVAQELRNIIPEAVQNNPDGYLTVNTDPIFWAMLNAVKELNTENDKLKQQILDLEHKLLEQDEKNTKAIEEIKAILSQKK